MNADFVNAFAASVETFYIMTNILQIITFYLQKSLTSSKTDVIMQKLHSVTISIHYVTNFLPLCSAGKLWKRWKQQKS